MRVNYANNTTFSSPFVMPQFQNTYGTGYGPFHELGYEALTPTSYDLGFLPDRLSRRPMRSRSQAVRA